MSIDDEKLKKYFDDVISRENKIAEFSAEMSIKIRNFCKEQRVPKTKIMEEIEKWNNTFGFDYEIYGRTIFESEAK